MPNTGLHLLAVEVTSHCNLACPHCYGAFDRTGAPMPLAWAERIAVQAEAMGVRVVTITGGEPLTLGDNLPDYIRPFATRSFRTFLTTNGVGIGSRIGRDHLDGLDGVQVSIDGKPAIHDRVRGRGRHAEAVSALRQLAAWGLPTAVMMTLHRDNVEDVPWVLELCREVGARLSLERYSGPGRNDTVHPASAESLQEAYRLALSVDLHSFDPCYTAFGYWHRGLLPKPGRAVQGGCTAGIAALGIASNLDVFPCVRLRLSVGNLGQSSLSDIWAGRGAGRVTVPGTQGDEILPVLRDRRRLEGACGDCRYSPVCGGCRAEAWHAAGRLSAADPSCPVPATPA